MNENIEGKCNELARVILPWGGKLLSYCPVHANQLVMLGNAIGSPIQAKLLPLLPAIVCESAEPLTDEEKELSKSFTL